MKLEVKDLSVFYGEKQALENITTGIPEHMITAVVGPSGCGKSTFLRGLNGLLREEKGVTLKGKILLDGENCSSLSPDDLRHKIGLVFQTPAPFPFSIKKNMIYGAKYYGLRNQKALDRMVEEKLTQAGLFDEVKDDLNKNALKLSGGQQQRLCIARALTVDPEVLLLDEPCSALDVKSSAAIESLLLSLKSSLTMVVVTHNLAQARRIADKVIFLYNGKLIEEGTADQVFDSPKDPITKDFLAGVFG